jgi:hypothetical protein
MLTSPVYAPDIDLGPIEGIDLEIAEAKPEEAGTHEMGEPANAALDLMPTLEREVIEVDVKQVYDLDVDEDLDGLTLGHILDDAGADDEDDEATEYTLEIEEDLEFEVDGLELEQDDEGVDEDDDR